MSEELAHHGVKGMHWGVRRQAEKNFKSFQKQQATRVQNISWSMSEQQYKSLSNQPIKLGKDFSRITATGKTDLRDFAFVTNNKNDRDIYRAFFGPSATDPNQKKDELSIKTSKEAVSPSEKTRVDTYIQTLQKNIARDKSFALGVTQTLDGPTAAKALNAREIGLRTYAQFAQTQHIGTKLHSEYFSALQRKGYNAVIDDADRNIVSNLPIILFPKQAGAHVTEIRPITKEDRIQAKLNVQFVS